MKVMAFAGLRVRGSAGFARSAFQSRGAELFCGRRLQELSLFPPQGRQKPPGGSAGFYGSGARSVARWQRKEALKAGRGGVVDLMFPDPGEKYRWPYSQRKIQTLMKRVCKAAKLRIRNPHDLRHTYASILLMAHESPGYVQKQLGHSSISITMDIYCHWIPGEGRKNLETALLGPAAAGASCTTIAPNRTKRKATSVSH